MTRIMLVGGLALLILGGELLVRGAVRTAQGLGVSPLLIGLTLVGFGTSTPELATSVQAALVGSPGVAVGNVVGSNIANVLRILGLGALMAPLAADRRGLMRDGPVLAASTLAALGLIPWGELGRIAGVALMLGLVGYVLYAYRTERQAPAAIDPSGELPAPAPRGGLWRPAGIALAGLVLVMLGAGWLVEAAIEIATSIGVSDTLIGLTLVAVGTSLPELR